MAVSPKDVGDRGEETAVAMLRKLFLEAKRVPNQPWDIVCYGLRARRLDWDDAGGPDEVHGDRDLHFYIQVKTGRSYGRRAIGVGDSTMRSWVAEVGTAPVVLLHLDDPERPRWRFMVLHAWLRSHVGELWQYEVASFHLSPDEFEDAGEEEHVLHDALKREADRAGGRASALFATLRSEYALVPVGESFLFLKPQLASFIEPSRAVVEALARDGRAINTVVEELLRTHREPSDPVVAEWCAVLRTVARVRAPYAARQMGLFFWTIQQFRGGKLLPLPPYEVAQTSAWRTYAVLYAHDALPFLRAVITDPRSQLRDVLFASALLPIPTYANDDWTRDMAASTLRELKKRADGGWHDGGSYRFLREINRSLAEGGERGYIEKAVQIVKHRDAVAYELDHLRHYGWPDQAIRANLKRKLDRPAERDKALGPFYVAMADVLLPRLPRPRPTWS